MLVLVPRKKQCALLLLYKTNNCNNGCPTSSGEPFPFAVNEMGASASPHHGFVLARSGVHCTHGDAKSASKNEISHGKLY